jgi:N-acetylneuraminate synthase
LHINSFKISNRDVGIDHPPLVIAEIGINHGGSLELAKRMANAAISNGAEVIKHQTHIIQDEMSEEAKSVIPNHTFESIYNIMEKCALSEEDEYSLMKYIQGKGAIFMSTPFSRAAANRLIEFDVPAIKIGSGECNNYPLIRHICKFGKPIILSTGMNTLQSIEPSVQIMRKFGIPFALLHCTNVYPTPPELVRLGAMVEIQNHFPDAVVGLSDHTTSNYTCLGSVALGASILERHFTDSMQRDGPDISCSMDPESLSDLIEGSQIIFSARGGKKEPVKEEGPTIAFAFASVVAIRDIMPGETLSEQNIWVKRPGGGDYGVNDFDGLLGKSAKLPIKSGGQIKREQISLT